MTSSSASAQPHKSAVKKAAATSVKSILIFLIFIEVTSGFVQGFYTPLLPHFADHLGVSGEAMNWFQTAQAMAAAVMVPLMSKLGDMYGPRRVLRLATAMVLVGTIVIALVPSYPIVLAARVLVGPLGVWLPLIIAIIYVRTAGGSATRSISIVSASLMAGIVLGTVAAGVSEQFAPSLVITLLVPAVLVALALLAAWFKLPKDIDLVAGRIDWLGFIGIGAIMVAFILALAFVGPSHAVLSTVLALSAVALFLLWLWWEKRAKEPAIDLGLVVSKQMGPLYLSAFVLGIVMIDAAPNLADYLSRDPEIYGYGFAASSTILAAMITVMLFCATVGAFASSFIAQLLGMRRMVVSAALVGAFGQLLLVVLPHTEWIFWISGGLTGFGLGVLVGTLPALVAHAAPKGSTGIANGIYAALLAMGGAVGGALFKQILVAFHDENRMTALGGYQIIWVVTALTFVVTSVMMMLVQLPGSVKAKNVAA